MSLRSDHSTGPAAVRRAPDQSDLACDGYLESPMLRRDASPPQKKGRMKNHRIILGFTPASIGVGVVVVGSVKLCQRSDS